MDTRKVVKIADCGVFQKFAGKQVVIGAKQLRKALASGRAVYVLLALDADPAITLPLEERCQDADIPFAWVNSMRELGSACGIEVGAAAAAAVDP